MWTKAPETQISQRYRWVLPSSSAVKFGHIFVLFSVCLFILSPLFNIVFQGLSATQLFGYWQNPQLWKALAYSLTMAPNRRDFIGIICLLPTVTFPSTAMVISP